MLLAWAAGDPDAAEQLVPLVYEELRKVAQARMRRERADHTLQSTALIHEAYVKLVNQRRVRWRNRGHFFAVASNLMRRILVDHARARAYMKRGGGAQRVSFDEVAIADEERGAQLLAIHQALTELERLDRRQARVVELRYFGGLTIEEIAEVTGISVATVKREWSSAKAWLHRELAERP